MMIKSLTYEQINEVEGHLKFVDNDIRTINEIIKDIAEESSYSIEPTGVHGTKMTDQTSDRASRIERETRELKKWVEVERETYNHFKHDPLMGEVYRQLYRERKGYQDIIEDMFIGQTSLYTYRREILYYATMRAVSKQLMEI